VQKVARAQYTWNLLVGKGFWMKNPRSVADFEHPARHPENERFLDVQLQLI
jgi:hypothetical protein